MGKFKRKRWLAGAMAFVLCCSSLTSTGTFAVSAESETEVAQEAISEQMVEKSEEELIAEIGAAALVHHAGLETSHSLRNSAAYIQNWLAVLKNDKRFIVSASGKADKAISLILGC